MRFTTKTEYGLVCLAYMARKAADEVTAVKEIAEREQFPQPYIQQIFHALCEANIVHAHHGRLGGYSLSRPASEITLRQIVEALEGGTFDVFCEPDVRKEITCTHFSLCGVKPVWQKTKDILDQFYGSITLDMMAKNRFNFDAVKL